MPEPLYLLDGYSLVFRSYFAFIRNPLRNPQGRNSSAIFGFFRSLFRVFDLRKPKRFAVVLDSLTPTFRHEQYAEYKANREETPEELREQLGVIEEMLSVLGVPALRVNGFEADDIMATLAERCRGEGRTCYLVSADKDLLQLVGGNIRVLKPEHNDFTELDRERVHESWSIYPEQVGDYLALVGDSSDNVPGVKGVGEKTASKLLSQFGTLAAIYERLGEISSKSQRTKLEEGRESAWTSRELVKLETEVPLDEEPEDLVLGNLDFGALLPYFEREGMRTLFEEAAERAGIDPAEARGAGGAAENAGAAGGPQDAAAGEAPGRPPEGPAPGELDFGPPPEQGDAGDQAAAGRGAGAGGAREVDPGTGHWLSDQQAANGAGGANHASAVTRAGSPSGLPRAGRRAERQAPPPELAKKGSYTLVTDLETLDKWLARIREAKWFAFDSETDSLDALSANPVGFSLAAESGQACYVPLRGPDGPVLDEDEVRRRLTPVLEDPELKLIAQNAKYDYKVLSRWGVELRSLAFDTMVAGWLLDTTANSFGLDELAQSYLGYTTVHYADLFPEHGRGKDLPPFWQVPLEAAGNYAAEDADITYRLYTVFEPLLRERGFSDLFYELELPLVPLLARMELHGIRINTDMLSAYSEELEELLGSIEEEIFELCGHEFNIASTKQLQDVLFVERKLKPIRKTKTGYSTDVAVLQELAREDPVPEKVLRHRLLSKLRSTYVDALPRLVNVETGRLHTHFTQTGTATGRLSSKDPNLQNIPIRDEEGRRIREAFVPEDGWVFVSADYSQIELVVLAHLSGDPGLTRAFTEGKDVHRETGALIFGVPAEDVTSAQRRIAKTINFGVMYGMSSFRLSRELNIARGEAESFIEAYFRTYPNIKSFVERTVHEAEKDGAVRTLLGRERPLPDITSRNRTVKSGAERIAVNTPIQGTAADIVKRAMLRVNARLAREESRGRILLQVHDELILEVPEEEREAVEGMVAEEMAGAVELSVPLRVNVESGSSWGELH
jgi:DNA polymerase-1